MSFFPTIEVNAHEAETIARGLYAIAAVDGVHERELALISEFAWGASTGADDTGGGPLGDGAVWPDHAARAVERCAAVAGARRCASCS